VISADWKNLTIAGSWGLRGVCPLQCFLGEIILKIFWGFVMGWVFWGGGWVCGGLWGVVGKL